VKKERQQKKDGNDEKREAEKENLNERLAGLLFRHNP